MEFKRYGVYYTPPPGPFAEAGAQWLGWDLAAGQPLESPAPEVTARPRKYGFHATMKPPFSLARGQTVEALQEGLATLCEKLRPVFLDGLKISSIGSFLAFTAWGDTDALNALAARCVRDLDDFRAPPSEAELARRRAADLDAGQEQNLQRWGYPHVMDRFRFHMTLSGPVPRTECEQVIRAAKAHFAACDFEPYMIDSLTLVGEAPDGQFHEVKRFMLA